MILKLWLVERPSLLKVLKTTELDNDLILVTLCSLGRVAQPIPVSAMSSGRSISLLASRRSKLDSSAHFTLSDSEYIFPSGLRSAIRLADRPHESSGISFGVTRVALGPCWTIRRPMDSPDLTWNLSGPS